MLNFIEQISLAGNHLAIYYNLDVRLFLIVYISSIIPIYLGAFLIIYGSTRHLKFRDIISFKLSNGLRFNNQTKVGIGTHLFGWLMPYLYIFLFAKNLPIVVYIILLIIILSLIFIVFKKIYSKQSFAFPKDITVIMVDRIVNENEVSVLWNIYDKTFVPINEKSPCRQSLDREHFVECLADTTVRKYVLSKQGNGVIGIAMITNDFKNTPWISADYFRVKFPKEYIDGSIFYFMGIAISSGYRGNKYSISMIENIIDSLPAGSSMGFDHSRNVNPFLHHFTKIVRQAKELKRLHIDRQHYHVITRN